MSEAPPAFHLLAKPAGARCNLACDYCFFLSKESLYPGSSLRMSDEVLEEYIRQYLDAHQAPEATIAWQGGGPTLMGLDFFRRSVELAKRGRRPGMEIQYTIQTNGTTLDDDWCRFFRENGFLVGISLYGPGKLHDSYRRDKRGKPTFQRLMAGLELLRKHKVDFNILATVNRANAAHPLDVYRFLRDGAEAQFIQFIPIVERQDDSGTRGKGKVSKRSADAERYGDFLTGVFDEWVRQTWAAYSYSSSIQPWAPGRVSPRAFASSPPPVATPWCWNTTATFIPATISSSPATCWAISWRRRWRSWSLRKNSAVSAGTSWTCCRLSA